MRRAAGNITERIARLMIAYQSSPLDFVRQVVMAEPTPQQQEFLHAIAPPGSHVSVKSGHGTGKTTDFAWSILWFLSCFPNAKIPCTAPTGHQLFDLLWPEVRLWRERMRQPWKSEVVITNDRVSIAGMEQVQFAVARTARPENPEALQGFHAENLLFLIDEASGVHEKVFEVAEGALSTEGARVAMAGNPTRTDGYFFNSHHKNRALWKCLHFSCLDSPIASKKYVEDMKRKYGEDSSIYRVRVLGEFPKTSDDVLIPLYLIEQAVGRDVQYPYSRKIAGLDVARFGDDSTALVVRQGQKIIHMEQWRNKDLMQTTGRVAAAFRHDKLFDEIKVDAIGLGSGVVDRLHELQIPCTGINVAEASAQKAEFNRLRDQLWWACRDFFEQQQCCIAPDLDLIDDLIGELSSIKYGFQSNGKIKVESKDEMKKRGLESPNLADALCLTFAEGTAGAGVRSVVTVQPVIRQSAGGWT